jgi:hypothetical protein
MTAAERSELEARLAAAIDEAVRLCAQAAELIAAARRLRQR